MSPRADKADQPSPSQLHEHVDVVVTPQLLDQADSVVESFGTPRRQRPQSTEDTDQEGQEEQRVRLMSGKETLFGYEMPFDVISAGYAALVAAGGIIGYLKAGSVPSLVAGLAFGSVLGVGTYMTSV